MTGPKHDSDELRYPNSFPEDFTYLQIPIRDEQNIRIIPHFKAAHDFIDHAMASGGRVLVHCEAGISRSSTFVISYLMKTHGFTLREALMQVKSMKPNIGPNNDFFSQLLIFEERLAKHQIIKAKTPSISLTEYLADQMLEGPAAMFSRNQIEKALAKAKNDPTVALQNLFASVDE